MLLLFQYPCHAMWPVTQNVRGNRQLTLVSCRSGVPQRSSSTAGSWMHALGGCASPLCMERVSPGRRPSSLPTPRLLLYPACSWYQGVTKGSHNGCRHQDRWREIREEAMQMQYRSRSRNRILNGSTRSAANPRSHTNTTALGLWCVGPSPFSALHETCMHDGLCKLACARGTNGGHALSSVRRCPSGPSLSPGLEELNMLIAGACIQLLRQKHGLLLLARGRHKGL
jgi:hypothetical protein